MNPDYDGCQENKAEAERLMTAAPPIVDAEQVAREIVDNELDEMMSPREYSATRRALIDRIAAALTAQRVAGEQAGLRRASEIAEEVSQDAQARLGLVPGNMAFENGRNKAANEIIAAILAEAGEK